MVSEALHLVITAIERDIGPIGGDVRELPGTAPGIRLLADIARTGPVFIKAADGSPEAEEAVGAEIALLSTLRHKSLPVVLGADAEADVPWMVQARLPEEGWTPPWPRKLKRVWHTIDALAALPPPEWLPHVVDVDPWHDLLTTADLAGRAEDLRVAAARVSLEGSRLVHGDLGGGNVHVDGRRVTVVDWSDAAVGNPDLDRLSVAVDAAHHSGTRQPPPVADLPAWMAKTAGLLLNAASRPPWSGEEGLAVRRAQDEMGRTAVAWALDLL